MYVRMFKGSTGEEIFVLGGPRKRYLARCQILCSKYYLYTFLKKVLFNIVKDFFKSSDIKHRSGKIQIGSKREGFIVLGGLRIKVLSTLSDFALKNYLYTI